MATGAGLGAGSGHALKAHLRKLVSDVSEMFWVLPVLMVVAGVLGAEGLVRVDRGGVVPHWLISSARL